MSLHSLDEWVTNGLIDDESSSAGHIEEGPWGAVALGRRFVETLFAEAGVPGGEGRAREADWEAIWDQSRAAPTLEAAIGRAILEAQRLVTDSVPQPPSRVGTVKSESPSESSVGGTSANRPGPSLAWTSTALVEPAEVRTAPLADPVELTTFPPVTRPPEETAAVPVVTAPARRLERVPWQVRAHRAFGWVMNIGAIIVLFAIWQIWGTEISQHHAQQSLRSQFDSKVHHVVKTTEVQLVPASASVPQPAEGTVVAHLQIPKIAVDQFVVEGTAESDLAKGPGHYVGTSLPGQAGNVAIAGHRTTYGAPFNHLDQLAVGDQIFLTTHSGERLTYLVSATPVPVSPRDVSVLNAFDDNRLTLTTCNPKFSASQRLIVTAELQQRVVPATAAGPAVKARKLHLESGLAGWRWSYLPWVALIVAVLVGLGLAHRRLVMHLGSVGRWIVLVPIWFAGLYVLFGFLTSFLPASV